ncbi:beta-propeller domain-containing protein, partial [Thermoplasmatota archaeon]
NNVNNKLKGELNMSTILSKIIAVSFVMVIIASGTYVFLTTNPNINIISGFPEYDISNFETYNDFNTYLQNNYESYNTNYYSPGLSFTSELRSGASDEGNQDIKATEDVDNYFSDTNIQELGVDEPDIIKTDGTYLYVISNLNLYIIYAYPTENAEIISSITFNESDRPNNLFINDDKLAVITQSYIYRIHNGLDEKSISEEIWQDTTTTHVFIYDLSDINKPTEIHDIEVEGYYSNARMIDDYVYIITTQYAYEPLLYKAKDSTYIPKIRVNNNEEKIGLKDIYYINSPDVAKTMTNILSFNIKEETIDVTAEVYILGNPSTIYVSTDNIFITSISNNYDYNTIYDLIIEYVLPYLPDEAKNELNNVNSLSIEDYQKITISEWIIQNYVEKMDEKQKHAIARQLIMHFEKTIIHKININNGEITYQSQGTVTGYVRNQFSISEYNNNLRIATTVNGWMMRPYLTSIESYNNVYVLDETLEIIGYIENIAVGEEIYSVRFLGEKCYLVTFKQIDPFFVIDLQDPQNPEILGELKIPGYSTYLHPYDQNNVIGIGQEGNNVKISLFNVEDVSNPQELSTYQIQQETEEYYWSYSSALYEHKAFLFDKSKNLLILPISTDYKELAYVFNITNNYISLKGIITHESENKDSEEEHEIWESDYWREDYGYSIKRSLFIEDVIYTISDSMIKMNDMETLNELNKISIT